MRGIHNVIPKVHLVRRVITRAPDLAGENYDSVSVAAFKQLAENGAFAVHWSAHGLHYGIPRTAMYQLNKGTNCLANFSRRALLDGSRMFPRFTVLNITARPETIAARLAARGRETDDEVAQRLAEADKPLPVGLDVIHLSNDGSLDQTVARAMSLLQPERA